MLYSALIWKQQKTALVGDFFRGSCTFNTTANLQMANLKMFCY